MQPPQSLDDKIKMAAEDSGAYFKYVADFIGFNKAQAEAIYESRYIIEKYIPEIVRQFYDHLLRYPETRKFFLNPDGSINEDYVQMRMQHLTNFWRRTAYGPYDDEYARYVDYVGRAHTKRGADPNIDIAERYVIGQAAYMQHAITEALGQELHEIDPEWEIRAAKAWNLLMMVILELLARAYQGEESAGAQPSAQPFDPQMVENLAIGAYEKGVGINRLSEIQQTFFVGREDEIPLGERKIVKLLGMSIGIFHHKSGWYAIQNKCLHAGGPVATGKLNDDTLTCPWHGYQYDLPTGTLLKDPDARLPMYPVEIVDGQIFIKLPVAKSVLQAQEKAAQQTETVIIEAPHAKNEFLISSVEPGSNITVEVDGEAVAVFNVDGEFYAIQEECTHAGGPLSEGKLDGQMVICPWHGSCFDVTSGAVLCGPATEAVRSFPVKVIGGIGRVG